MGAIAVSDELQCIIEREVAAGRAATATAFVEEAVLRLIEDAREEAEDIARVAAEGIADIKAGRFVTIASSKEHAAFFDGVMDRVRARRAAGK